MKFPMAILFVLLLLGIVEAIRDVRRNGWGHMRFLTDSRATAWVMIVVGVVLTGGVGWILMDALLNGEMQEFCGRRASICARYDIHVDPLDFWLAFIGYAVVATVCALVILLGINTLRWQQRRSTDAD
jgi:hypothetical protein